MFVAHDVLLDVSFSVARPRLVGLTSSRALIEASRAAYREGLASQACEPVEESGLGGFGQIRIMPGAESGIRLARVRLLPPVERRDSTTVGLRWETTGVVAGLFPVLDADITLAAAGEHTATLTLSGVYRSPCGDRRPALLAAPVAPGVGTPIALPPEPPSSASLEAAVAVQALLRFAARHLTGLIS